MRKFKNYQKVVVPNFLINGNRMDTWGIVEGYDPRSSKYLVTINSVIVYLEESKLVDFEEFWNEQHKKDK